MWCYHHLRKEDVTPFPHLPATFSHVEILPKSQRYNSSMFPTITPPSHLLQGHLAVPQNLKLSVCGTGIQAILVSE